MVASCSDRDHLRRAAVALLSSLLAATLAACPVAPAERRREVAGVFSEQGTPLIVEARWTSTDPDAAWFNDATAVDWRVTLSRTDAALGGREALAVVDEPASGGGTFGLGALSWHEGVGRVVALVQGAPVLVSTDVSAPLALTLDPGPALSAVFGADGARVAAAADAWMSPDGTRVAALWLLAYEGPGGGARSALRRRGVLLRERVGRLAQQLAGAAA
jgi:hypothetical protein